jgi:aspartyl-tRNA(Asn)/glutamyl-tRNA(Gln) amidotransferase subunit A
MTSGFLSAEKIRDGVISGDFSAQEILKHYFEKISAADNDINAFLTLCEEDAFKQARTIDQMSKGEKAAGKLCGVPIAIKDNICTEGIRTTCGSRMLEDFVPPYNATVIKRLKEEGAIILGKTNMDEFAMGSSTENSAFKITKNPRNLTRVPGGSSGGSAAAVAADMVPIALGSDTGGSIRQPASFCGVIGLKPTYGLVSRFGLIAFGSSLDQIGPFSKTVRDNALLLEVIQGEDKLDSTSFSHDAEPDYLTDISKGIKGYKIGVPAEFFKAGLDSEIRTSMKTVFTMLQTMGAEIEEFSLPLLDEGLAAYYLISSAEASSNLARYDGIRYGYRTNEFEGIAELIEKTRSEAFGDEVKRRIMLGTYSLSSGYYDAYYKKAQQFRAKLKSQFSEAFKRYDLIISPTSPILPFKIGERSHNPLEMYLADIYTVNVNLTGLPAISIPCGLSRDSLPLGLQLIGPHFGESRLFRAAYAMEQELCLNL